MTLTSVAALGSESPGAHLDPIGQKASIDKNDHNAHKIGTAFQNCGTALNILSSNGVHTSRDVLGTPIISGTGA